MDDKLAQIITMGIEAFASVVMTYFLIQRNIRKNSERFDRIDRRLDAQYEYIKEATIKAGISVAWGEKAPFDEVIEAILMNLHLGANGNTAGRLSNVIIGYPNGLQLFNSMYNRFIKEHKVSDKFIETVKEATKGLK
ncbi:MAG: hypothetical protein LBU85_08840 [Treponema sp.]|jgi:hypothetical protein|nr:hypothetical protein [Treponema sp.]